jgi:endonuclease/exonuclease/phosphatase family metal-dependent hydrolase
LVRQVSAYEHAIAVGDYNTEPGEEPYRTISAKLQESWSEKYPDGVGELPPVMRPVREVRSQASSEANSGSGDKITLPDRIDHIFVSKSFRVVEAYYLPAPDSQTDHPAHWAVVKWEREERPERARVK